MAVQKYLSGSSAVNIAASVEGAIAHGRLAAGALLPAVRAAAAQLGVSPATVAAAYRLLQDRGVVSSDGRRGTRVRPAPPITLPRSESLPRGVTNLADGNPDPDLLPDADAALRGLAAVPRLYGQELNDERLLELARRQFRGDAVPADHVAIVSGALDGIDRVLREHLRAGDRVAVEDPSFTGILDLLSALSLVPVAVSVDDQGMLPSELKKAIRSCHAMIATPRAQNPTGAAFSPRRVRELRAILALRPELLVIEDDHAGIIAGAEYVTLVDRTRARWAVVRSVSKSLGPDLRLALLASDERTHARVEGRQSLGIRWVSHILQRAVAAMLRDRDTQRLLARAAKTYSARRAALLAALASHGLRAHGVSGLNVWIEVPEESAIVQALLQRGWGVKAGERYRLETRPAIRVTISTLQSEDAKRFASDLASILQASRRTAGA
jgi:DNA-binding transcriptional MocR family regulator